VEITCRVYRPRRPRESPRYAFGNPPGPPPVMSHATKATTTTPNHMRTPHFHQLCPFAFLAYYTYSCERYLSDLYLIEGLR
jgi:hypothetical protein